MKEQRGLLRPPFVFYRALDPQKGSWDGYGHFPLNGAGFLAYVSDAPSGASIQTPELIHTFLESFAREHTLTGGSSLGQLELADIVNRLQDHLKARGRSDAALYQSTFCAALVSANRLFAAAIGDSILLLLRNGALHRLDGAETWNGALIVRDREDLRERQQTGPVQFAGADGAFFPPSAVTLMELLPGDRLILATDGIADRVTPARLRELLHSADPRADLESLFTPERIPDDVTLMILDPAVEPQVDAAAEVRELRAQQAPLQREVAGLSARLESLENQNAELRRKVGELSAHRAPRFQREAPVSSRPSIRDPKLLWVWLAIAFLAGVIATGTLALLWPKKAAPLQAETPAPRSRTNVEKAEPARRIVTPPEIPAPASCSYIVQKGDTLQKIASEQALTVPDLLRLNPGLRADAPIQIGQEMQVCGGVP